METDPEPHTEDSRSAQSRFSGEVFGLHDHFSLRLPLLKLLERDSAVPIDKS